MEACTGMYTYPGVQGGIYRGEEGTTIPGREAYTGRREVSLRLIMPLSKEKGGLCAPHSLSPKEPGGLKNTQNVKIAEKTLEWSTILTIISVLTVLRIPGFSPPSLSSLLPARFFINF